MPAKRGQTTSEKPERMFVAEIGRTDAGSIRIRFRPAPPLRSPYGHHRALNALIYRLAAEFERQCERLGLPWPIAPYPFDAHIDIELSDGDEPDAAEEVVLAVLADSGVQVRLPSG
jgi:hypothetical protein